MLLRRQHCLLSVIAILSPLLTKPIDPGCNSPAVTSLPALDLSISVSSDPRSRTRDRCRPVSRFTVSRPTLTQPSLDRDNVPLHSLGISLTFLLPSAFVALDDAEVQSKPIRSRLRITSAGVFHNLLYFALLSACGRALPSLWFSMGYEDVSIYGRVVLSVDEVCVYRLSVSRAAAQYFRT
jgi:hypothetical protein